MSITYTAISPKDGDTNISTNTEVVFRIIKNDGEIDLSSLSVVVTFGFFQDIAIQNGSFQNEYGGEIIDNSNGNLTNITVIIIRPPSEPEYQQGQKVTIGVSVL